MDPVAREDIAAAAAARREFGSSYDEAFAESLIDRIGAEIDKRVDAKLESRRRSRSIDVAELKRRRALWTGAVIGAAVTGTPALMAAMQDHYSTRGVIAVIILIWAVIAVGYTITRWAHSLRERDD